MRMVSHHRRLLTWVADEEGLVEAECDGGEGHIIDGGPGDRVTGDSEPKRP